MKPSNFKPRRPKPASTNARRKARKSLGSRTSRRRNTGMFPRMVGIGKPKPGGLGISKQYKGREHQRPQPRVLVEKKLRDTARRTSGDERG